MLKTKIFSMGNKGKYNYMIINKNRDTLSWLDEVFNALSGCNSFLYEYNEDKKPYQRKRNIKNFTDKKEVYTLYGYTRKKKRAMGLRNGELIVFYGRDKIYLTFECTIKYRKEILGRMESISYWKKTN